MKNRKVYGKSVVLTLSALFLSFALSAQQQHQQGGGQQQQQQPAQQQQNVTVNTGENNNSGRVADTDYPKGEFGIRFMPTFSKFQLHDAGGGKVEGDFTAGYGFGVLLGINFQEHVGLQGELLYSAIAQKYRDKELDRTIKLHYVNIPLLLSLNTGKSKIVNLNVVAGPQIGINVGSDIEPVEGDEEVAVLAVRKGDLGLAYGAGLQFGHNVKFDIGFRGVYGLIDISDDSKTNETGEYYILDKTHIQTYSLYAGVAFLF